MGDLTSSIGAGLATLAAGIFHKISRVRSLLFWAIGLVGFLALILVVLHFGSIERIMALAQSAQPIWLLVALLAQAGTYLAAALVWRQALQRVGHPMPLSTLVPVGVAKVFTDQVLPSGGVSGTMLVVRALIRRHVPPKSAMAAMVAGLVSFDIAYLLVVLTSTGILWFYHRMTLPLLIGVAIFVVMTIAIPSAILCVKRWNDRPLVAWVTKILGMTALLRALTDAPTDLLDSPRLLIQIVCLQVGIFMLDALTLWLAFNAIGQAPALWVVLVSFIISSMVATIGPIPVGLGTFEAASVAMLHLLGVSLEAALAATLLLRGFTFWLPMLPGIWLARREFADN